MGWTTDDWRFNFTYRQEIVSYSKASRQVLGLRLSLLHRGCQDPFAGGKSAGSQSRPVTSIQCRD